MLGTKFSPEKLLPLHTGFLSVCFICHFSVPLLFCQSALLSLLVMILFFLQAIGLSLRDLLAHVDEEIQRLDPSSHKEVSLH